MEDQKEKNKVFETVDQEKINRIVYFVTTTYNEIEEGYQATNTATTDQMLAYISEMDYTMGKRCHEICEEIGDSEPNTLLKGMSTFIEEEKKKLKKDTDQYDFIDTISKIIRGGEK